MSIVDRLLGAGRRCLILPSVSAQGKHQTDVFGLLDPRKRGGLREAGSVSFVEGEKAARGSDRIETHQGSSLALEHRMAAVEQRSGVPHFTRCEAERHVAARRSHPLMERLTRGLTNPSSRSRPVEPGATHYPAGTCFGRCLQVFRAWCRA